MRLEEIERIVREKLIKSLAGGPAGAGAEVGESLVNLEAVQRARKNGGKLLARPGAIVTPLARDEIEKHGVELVLPGPAAKPAAAPAPVRSPNPRRIALASDHGGFEMKQLLVEHVRSLGYEADDLGTHSAEAVDYPDFAHRVAQAVVRGEAARGIIVDGVGIGSAITANKVPGIRAAHCRDLFEVKNSREHNDANVLTLGGRVIGSELAKALVTTWLETPFAGGRHAGRIEKIRQVEAAYGRA